MIVTITCNPAIDKTVYDNKTVFDIGGKGINVSKVLDKLNTKSIVTGFIGKDNKQIVIDDLNRQNIENHFIEVDGRVRTNIKYIVDGKLTEVNEDGPIIKNNDIENLFKYLNIFNKDIVVISGSAPKSCDKNIYKDMIELLKNNDNYVILDCSGDLLKYAMDAKPDMIKPNRDEICDYFGCEYDEDEIVDKCKKLDIDLICLSLGEDGAIIIDHNNVCKCKALDVNCSSLVGAGDAMVASFAYGKDRNLNIEDTIKLAMAAASAACETEGTKAPEYDRIVQKIDSIIL